MVGHRILGLVVLACAIVAASALPAHAGTLSVDTVADELNDDGDCSLREAVQAANTNARVDECERGRENERDMVKLKPKSYALAIPSTDEDANANGDLDVSSGGPLTILGVEQSGGTDISQGGDDRIFDLVGLSPDLTVEKTDLQGGDVTSFSSAEARGGSIRASATSPRLKLRRVTIENANARTGGAIYASNSAKMSVNDSQLVTNEATVAGGAIATSNAARVKVKGSTLTDNSVTSTADSILGGAIMHQANTGKLTVLDSSLALNQLTASGSGNTVAGGAIQSSGPLEIRRSFLGANTILATTSGAAERGGGLSVTGGPANIVNSTFFQNDAGDSDGRGGGLYVGMTPQVSVQFTTFAGNTATDGGDSLAGDGAGLEIGRSIIDDSVFGTPCDGNVLSTGFNVSEVDDPDCVFEPTDDVDVGDVGLENNANDNGGRTETVAIERSSPARNFVPKRKCDAAKGEDQRRFERPAGKACDSGAFERGAESP